MHDIEAEHAHARPLEVSDLRLLVSAYRVPPRAVTHSWAEWYAPIRRERVVFEETPQICGIPPGKEGGQVCQPSRFEFSRYRPEVEAVNAYTLPLYSEAGDPDDIFAFRPNGPAMLWLGRAAMAGAEQMLFPRGDEPLDAHADVLGWLRADRRGIVILDHARAAERLQGVTLRCATAEHAWQLRTALTRPAPTIKVNAEVPARHAA